MMMLDDRVNEYVLVTIYLALLFSSLFHTPAHALTRYMLKSGDAVLYSNTLLGSQGSCHSRVALTENQSLSKNS